MELEKETEIRRLKVQRKQKMLEELTKQIVSVKRLINRNQQAWHQGTHVFLNDFGDRIPLPILFLEIPKEANLSI